MTNLKSINVRQKNVMAEFMAEHSNFAKNLLPNCAQGRALSNRLWETLTVKLNAYGPPTKNSKMWRKVYSDQKFHVKQKVTFNKNSKKKTGGGPYEEMPISTAEEQIIQAAGIDVAVEGLSAVKSFGTPKNSKVIAEDEQYLFDQVFEDEEESESQSETENEEIETEEAASRINRRPTKAESKLNLLKENLEKLEKAKTSKNEKLERLLKIKERSQLLKEEEHVAKMAIYNVDLEIKQLELKLLKQKL